MQMLYVGNDTFLCHHGIKGQNWGKKNGPPYPLDSKTHNSVVKSAKKKITNAVETHKAKKQAKEDAKEAKREEKAAKQLKKDLANPNKMWKNREMYSTKEIREAVDRMRAEKDLYDMKVTQLKRPKEMFDLVNGYMQTANNFYNNADTMYKNYQNLKNGKFGGKKSQEEKDREAKEKVIKDFELQEKWDKYHKTDAQKQHDKNTEEYKRLMTENNLAKQKELKAEREAAGKVEKAKTENNGWTKMPDTPTTQEEKKKKNVVHAPRTRKTYLKRR